MVLGSYCYNSDMKLWIFGIAALMMTAGCVKVEERQSSGEVEGTPVASKYPEHLVRLHIPINADKMTPEGFVKIQKKYEPVAASIEKAVKEVGGYMDGDEIGPGEYTLWFYSMDSKTLTKAVRDAAKKAGLGSECKLYIRAGAVDDKNAPTTTVSL